MTGKNSGSYMWGMKGALPLCMPCAQLQETTRGERLIIRKGIFIFSFSMLFGAPINIFFIVKVKILMFIE